MSGISFSSIDLGVWFYQVPVAALAVVFWAVLVRLIFEISLYLLKIPARFFGLID